MHEIGSDGWLAAFAPGATDDDADRPGGRPDLVVPQELTDSGAAWHVEVAGARARVVRGRHPSPDVTISQDTPTARASNHGELAAQQAFVDGRLRVRGDVGRLPEAVDALSTLPAVPG